MEEKRINTDGKTTKNDLIFTKPHRKPIAL